MSFGGRAASAGLLATFTMIAACGGSDERPKVDADDAFSEVEKRSRQRPDPNRAAPRWEPVRTLRGSARTAETLSIAPDAINWRARWRCERGRITLSVAGEQIGRGGCPGSGAAESLSTGRVTLDVEATGPWRVRVSQQVTDPLDEPPLPGMRAELAGGAVYGVERRGTGHVGLYRLPAGRLALRFEGFSTSANSDLFVWLSEARRPRTTRQALRASHRPIALLKSTVGDQNYILPRGVDEAAIRSVVIWCEPVRIAYAAATLAR